MRLDQMLIVAKTNGFIELLIFCCWLFSTELGIAKSVKMHGWLTRVSWHDTSSTRMVY